MSTTKDRPVPVAWQPIALPNGLRRFASLDQTSTSHTTGIGKVVCYSSRSPVKESANEDALAVIETVDGSLLLIVADGMGGQAAGEQAAFEAVSAVCEAVLDVEPGEATSLRPAILDGIEAANRRVIDLGVGAGATLAIVEITGRIARPYHVGDAAIVLMGQRGKVKFASVAHSPVGYAEAAGVIDANEAMHHEERHIVSNFVGYEEMRIEIGPSLTLGRYDTLLLASDGLTDNLTLDEVVATLKSGPLDRASNQLATTTRERMVTALDHLPSKPDDLTFVVFRPTA